MEHLQSPGPDINEEYDIVTEDELGSASNDKSDPIDIDPEDVVGAKRPATNSGLSIPVRKLARITTEQSSFPFIHEWPNHV